MSEVAPMSSGQSRLCWTGAVSCACGRKQAMAGLAVTLRAAHRAEARAGEEAVIREVLPLSCKLGPIK